MTAETLQCEQQLSLLISLLIVSVFVSVTEIHTPALRVCYGPLSSEIRPQPGLIL